MKMSESASDAGKAQIFGQHNNMFGFLRLLFASAVILSHVPEIIDGSRSNEILTRLFGSISLGDFSVDMFFLISGYLITNSFIGRKSLAEYVRKRLARIFPGFICAYFICVLIVAPIGGAKMPGHLGEFLSIVVRALLLQAPNVGNVFHGTMFPFLNASMWTISIEFKCYLLVIVMGYFGLFGKRHLVLIATAALLVIAIFLEIETQPFDTSITDRPIPNIFSISEWNSILFGAKKSWLRLSGIFLTGSCFFLYRDVIIFKLKYVLISTAALALCLFVDRLAHFGVAIFGAYILFSISNIKNRTLSKINNKNDISYGVYLYAWPTTKVILLISPHMSVINATVLTVIISYILGWVSWVCIERPVLALVKSTKHASPLPNKQSRLAL
ncbi:acyltransferase family protein [Bosea sp. NBC_00550]|uniref:acyltransferase family protein n=1 Tax=Bosea sp. NBC_00550 TaxID=2969621 RepID=UPI002231D1E4|nr:acyltransferase [Bosea sp. NBC_00550]UZF95860.1 acyltransferase [Bosea sp. NBC_00550]